MKTENDKAENNDDDRNKNQENNADDANKNQENNDSDNDNENNNNNNNNNNENNNNDNKYKDFDLQNFENYLVINSSKLGMLFIIIIYLYLNLFSIVQRFVAECLACPVPCCFRISLLHTQTVDAGGLHKKYVQQHNQMYHQDVNKYCLLSIIYLYFIYGVYVIHV